MNRRTIIWITSRDSDRLPQVALQLENFGYQVLARAADASLPVAPALRILPLQSFRHLEDLRAEYIGDTAPTLILVDVPHLESGACSFARPRDEIGLSSEPAELIARRLNLLYARSSPDRLADDLRDAQDRLEKDPLTGLLNWRGAEARSGKVLEQSPLGGACAFVFLDLDHFKQINDALGHAAGDAVLKELATLLRDGIRETDLCARLGGDEFLLVLTGPDEAAVKDVMRRILETVEKHIATIGGRQIQLSLSAGLVFVSPGASFSEIIDRANVAMYQAKSEGRHRLVEYDRLEEDATRDEEAPYLRNFENVVRVVNERVTAQITVMARRLMKEAWRQANEDPVTGLWSRRYFETRIVRELEVARRRGTRLAIAMADLDDFRAINSRFGYTNADRALQRFSKVARGSLSMPNWVARWGGEEFVMVMPGVGLQDCAEQAEKIRRAVEALSIDTQCGEKIRFTASIGVAAFTRATRSSSDLVDKAARALRRAKDSGKNRVEVEIERDEDDDGADEMVPA